jgi:hypothetical protein
MATRLLFVLVLPRSGGQNAMSQTKSTNPNPVQKSLGPMVTTWTRCISWTVLLSLLLAVLFALALDGCSRI